MTKAKQVMDFRPSKGITTAQSNEHLRKWTEKGRQSAIDKSNYDPTREWLNFEIKHGKVCPVDKSRSIPERMADILRERGIKDPNEGLAEPFFRTVVNFIFGGSRERMHELAFGDQQINAAHGADNSHIHRCRDIETWAKDVYSFVSEQCGEENIAAFIVHPDETNPHIHCTLLPVRDGKFAYKKIFAGKDKYEFSARMKELHSRFAEVNEKWGMSRGSSISETGAKHRSTEEYRRDLSQKCTTIEQTIEEHRRTLYSLQAEIRLAERCIKGLTSMVRNLRQEKTEKEAAADSDICNIINHIKLNNMRNIIILLFFLSATHTAKADVRTTDKNTASVVRMLAAAEFRKLRCPDYHFNEVCRLWMNDSGKTEVTGLCRTIGYYIDSFIFDDDIDLRKRQGDYKYLADISFVYPRYKVLPVFKRNGVRGALPDVPMLPFLHSLLTDSRIETMMKAGNGKAIEYFLKDTRSLDRCWSSYKVAQRNGYVISDYALWDDYIHLLIRNGNDIHNAHFVCPEDLQAAHDNVLHSVQIKDERRARNEKRAIALENEPQFKKMKGKFFGLHFSDGEIEISSLDSVKAYLEEGTAMHHCCFDLAYYLKPHSLCLSARIDGQRIETIELSLTTFKVIQSRGLFNTNTQYHDRIIELVERNGNLVQKRMKA